MLLGAPGIATRSILTTSNRKLKNMTTWSPWRFLYKGFRYSAFNQDQSGGLVSRTSVSTSLHSFAPKEAHQVSARSSNIEPHQRPLSDMVRV